MHTCSTRGIKVPEILLPNDKTNMKKWAVIACDQYTSNDRYWDDVEKLVGNAYSTLHMILPEIYLNCEDKNERIKFAQDSMHRYLKDGILTMLPEGFVLVERRIGSHIRKGIMVAIDLDEYSYDETDHPLIRASEETVLERIPPRVAIRKNASVELPHIMVMIDDPDNTVIGPIYTERAKLPVLYDFELMMGGGAIKGYMVDKCEDIDRIIMALDSLELKDGMRYCVGDGNHSLATAKVVWENAKATLSDEERETSPLRYALVELINMHDSGIEFHPIHRILFNINVTHCIQYIVDKLNSMGCKAKLIFTSRRRDIASNDKVNVLPFISKTSVGRIEISEMPSDIMYEVIQPILEQYIKENQNAVIDYIHNSEELIELANGYDTLGIFLTALSKDTFTETVIDRGVLPKKSFSMGEAEDKRYYLECRLLIEEEEEPEEETVEEDELLEETDESEVIETEETDLEEPDNN